MSESKPEARAMTRPPSAEERDTTVKLLTAAFTDDAIAVDEFERRVAAVYQAESTKALEEITRDLPAAAPGAVNVPTVIDQSMSVAHRRPLQRVRSVLSAVERSVSGPVPERLEVKSVAASVELDLRRADFPPGVTEIHLKAIAGNIEIELPEHVHVEDEGHAFLGVFAVRGRSRPRDGEPTPVVRITGRSIMSNIEVELDD